MKSWSSCPPEEEPDYYAIIKQQEDDILYGHNSDSDSSTDDLHLLRGTNNDSGIFAPSRKPDLYFLEDLDAYFAQEEMLLSWMTELMEHESYKRECLARSEWKYPEGWDDYDSDFDDEDPPTIGLDNPENKGVTKIKQCTTNTQAPSTATTNGTDNGFQVARKKKRRKAI